MQSDVYEVAKYMRTTFHAAGDLFEPDVWLHPERVPDSNDPSELLGKRVEKDVPGAGETSKLAAELRSCMSGDSGASDHVASDQPCIGQHSEEVDRVEACGAHESISQWQQTIDRVEFPDRIADSAQDSRGASSIHADMNAGEELAWAEAGWLKRNPLPTPTEREMHTINSGSSVWRLMLVRK